jgi:hypothetical protein
MKTSFSFTTIGLSLITAGSLWVGFTQAEIPENALVSIWQYDEGAGNQVKDRGVGAHGTLTGGHWTKDSLRGDGALEFNGKGDSVKVVNAIPINDIIVRNRTILALFKPADLATTGPQVIYEEGGITRGFNIYVDSGKLYVGAWNTPDYVWRGEWPSVPYYPNRWYFAGLVLRDARDKLEKNKLEMWLNGTLLHKVPGGQVFPHIFGISPIPHGFYTDPQQRSKFALCEVVADTNLLYIRRTDNKGP